MSTQKRKKVAIATLEQDYENLILAAFELESILTQNELEHGTNEPWKFLKPIVEKLCEAHQNTQKGKCWVLKPQYRLASNTNTNESANVNLEPPKKKRKKVKSKSSFWLVKIPKWLSDEWFDDTKYPNCSRLGELYVIPAPDAKDKDKKKMKLEITAPLQMRNSAHSSHSSHSIPIPTQFKMEQRQQRNRINVKHGELIKLEQDRLLVFQDKPCFPLGSKVEALDNHNNNANSDNGNGNSMIKGYAKGVIKEINHDRTFTVQFNKSKKQRYKVPQRDIRFEDMKDSNKANKCKILGVVNGEMDVTPQWTPQYKKYLQLRSMKKAFQHTMQIKEKKNIFHQSREERDKEAMQRINSNRKLDKRNVKSNKNRDKDSKKKRVKNVRKDEKIYESMIFAAFEKDSCLTQKDMESGLNEPWNFLKTTVQKLCDRHQNTAKGRSWVLKPEFRLATDSQIQTPTNTDE